METDDYDRALEARIDRDALRRMNAKQRMDFASVMRTASDVVHAFSSEPRFQRIGCSYGQNIAGGLLSEVEAFLQGYADAAIDVAKVTKPGSVEDAEHRSLTLLEDAICRHVELPEIVGLAARAVADEAIVRDEQEFNAIIKQAAARVPA